MSHEEAIPNEWLNGEGTDLARRLGQGGLVLSPEPGKRKALLRYLFQALRKVNTRVRLVDTHGWHQGAFVMPSGLVLGGSSERIHAVCDGGPALQNECSGSLEGWQEGVARYAVGNPHLAFGICTAFAGPLLDLIRPDGGGGFNLQGFSSKGKSTVLEVAASVWGRPDPLPTWRATGNGLEGIAASRNDGFLVLDELGQVDPKEAGQVAYMLANGSSKARGNRDGGTRPMKKWRLIFLSSGEQGLEDKLAEDGKRAKAGQEVRVPDIPCPEHGMFECAHAFPTMGALAEHLKREARSHYGHAAQAFLLELCQAFSEDFPVRDQLRQREAHWLEGVLQPGFDAQVRRVAGRFALVAVAGDLATRMGILPWPEGEAFSAVRISFQAWFEKRGFSGASEIHRGIESLLAFLDRHGLSRFDLWGEADSKVINRAGTRKRAEGIEGFDYYLTPEGWKEACGGTDPKAVAKACAAKGLLDPGHAGRSAQSVSIPGHGKARCYVIRAIARAQHESIDAA